MVHFAPPLVSVPPRKALRIHERAGERGLDLAEARVGDARDRNARRRTQGREAVAQLALRRAARERGGVDSTRAQRERLPSRVADAEQAQLGAREIR